MPSELPQSVDLAYDSDDGRGMTCRWSLFWLRVKEEHSGVACKTKLGGKGRYKWKDGQGRKE